MAEREARKLSFLEVVKSVLASFFGVQSGRNYRRDFSQGNALHFIVVALVLTALFVLAVWGAVQLALPD